MIQVKEFHYKPTDDESEKASNSYLMSLIALIAGLPLPVVNLIATLAFYLGNRRGAWFVRWHCTQALLTQIVIFPVNMVAFVWTLMLIFSDMAISNGYIAYLLTVILFNLAEFIGTIISATSIRKGRHVEWYFFGALAAVICKENANTAQLQSRYNV